jgi:hypothetical protein
MVTNVVKDGEQTVTAAALKAEFWAEYLALQEMWRMGEALTLARWGRGQREGATREMRQLRQELAALLVGFRQ